jgi:hypothetical protein
MADKQPLPLMATFIDRVIADRRTLRQALADIRAKYENTGDPDLAEMIRHGEAEITERESKLPAEVG